MSSCPRDNVTGPVAIEPAPGPAIESRLRLYGSAAALHLVEPALEADDAPSVAFVRGGEVAHERAADFDAAIVLSPSGERFSPRGMHWRHLGDFVPVVLEPARRPGNGAEGHEPSTRALVVVRRWLPIVEECLPQLRAGLPQAVRPERDLVRLERVWRREVGTRAVVSLAALDQAPFFGATPVAIREVQPSRVAYRAGEYPFGVQVHLVFSRRTAKVEQLLEHLLRGAGRAYLRRVLI